MLQLWSSHSLNHRRVQDGGWSRHVKLEDLPISQDIAGVNMRLTARVSASCTGTRPASGRLMLDGNCRLTALHFGRKLFVSDVTAGDLPPGALERGAADA